MDGFFDLPEAARTDFLRSLVHSFGCAYVSLWLHDHSNFSNRLLFLDGLYNNVTNNQPSSSLGSIAERLFHQYQRLTFDVNHECVPGVAFRNQLPYLELQQLDLLRLTSTQIQTQFYQEARIKVAVFMGCNKGEIELGFSNMTQVDIQTALRNLFPEDLSTHDSQKIDKNPASSSSSSFISGSPECSSLLFTSQSNFPTRMPISSHQQSNIIQDLFPSHFPSPEGEHDALIKAFLHVISSSPSSSSHHQHQPQQNLPNYNDSVVGHPEATAFKRYRPINIMGSNFGRQSLLNRSIAFSRTLNLMRTRERIIQAPPPTVSQLHHMISERRRREKLNGSFQALRALLPPGTKKDKASILTTAKETMKSVMEEIEKLNIRNQQLMTLLSVKEAIIKTEEDSSNERLNVRVSHVSASSSSEERMVDLLVIVRGESTNIDILIRLLEFLGSVQNVISLISTGANNYITEGTAINQLAFRLRILEGSEWDGAAFQEAVRRVVADLLQCESDH